MENWVFYFLSFGAVVLGIVLGNFYFGTTDPYDREEALLDLTKPRDPWDILAQRCEYCAGKTSKMTDRCSHCGAPT